MRWIPWLTVIWLIIGADRRRATRILHRCRSELRNHRDDQGDRDRRTAELSQPRGHRLSQPAAQP